MLPLPRSISKLAAAAVCGLAFTFAAPVAMNVAAPSAGLVASAHAQQPSEFKEILSRYGAFQAHEKYGEVWIPAAETAPAGWHPYPPCNWVHTKDLGWYFNDKSEWGRIVHHYGRWAHDKDLGWVWVRGEEFSPGWVVWRTSDKWVGWAPLPPDQDVQTISATEFNSDKQWIFVEASKFASSCQGGQTVVAAPSLYPVILQQTTVVTNIKFVNGIAIFVLPPPLLINVVDVDINIGVFNPWSPCFLGAWFWNWNFMVNIININVNLPQTCPQPGNNTPVRSLIPIRSTPPPAPGNPQTPDRPTPPNKRVDLVPPSGGPNLVPVRPLDPGIRLPGGDKGPTIRPIDPNGKRPIRPTVNVKLPEGDKTPGRTPNRNTDGGGKAPQANTPVRTTVPKLVRTPQLVTKHPAVTQRVANGEKKKPATPNIR